MYALKANNNENELKTLRKLLGDEFMDLYDREIEEAVQIYRERTEKDKTINVQKLQKETKEELKDVEYLNATQKEILEEQIEHTKD